MPISAAQHRQFSDAIESGQTETVERLLAQHPSLIDPPSWTPPPLHCAVLWNQPHVATCLLDHGADLERRDPDQNTTPLRYAIMFAQAEVIPLLLARGANTGPIETGGTTALELARQAAAGDFAAFDDLPRPSQYHAIVALLESHDVQ